MLKKTLSYLPTLALLIFVLYRVVPSYLENSKIEGTPIPPFELRNLDGVLYESQSDQDQRRIYVFWATWCTPCKLELSRLQSMIDDKKIRSQQIHAISSLEDERLLKKTASKRGYTFPIFADHDGSIARAFNVQAVPTIIYKERGNLIDSISTGISPLLGFKVERFLN